MPSKGPGRSKALHNVDLVEVERVDRRAMQPRLQRAGPEGATPRELLGPEPKGRGQACSPSAFTRRQALAWLENEGRAWYDHNRGRWFHVVQR